MSWLDQESREAIEVLDGLHSNMDFGEDGILVSRQRGKLLTVHEELPGAESKLQKKDAPEVLELVRAIRTDVDRIMAERAPGVEAVRVELAALSRSVERLFQEQENCRRILDTLMRTAANRETVSQMLSDQEARLKAFESLV